MNFKQYLIDKKSYIKKIEIQERELDISPNIAFITSLVGPRRAGKTYQIYNFIKRRKLKDGDYVFVNFEDDEIFGLGRDDILNSILYHIEIYGTQPRYMFFDEVQAFEGWERIIYTLYERKQYSIVITSSSSKLLSREIATQLRGRSIPVLILPFSFSEFIKLKGIEPGRDMDSETISTIKNALLQYLKYGGFPDIVLGNIVPEKFFMEYIDVLILKDVIEREHIRNIYVVKFLSNAILASYSREFSVHKNYLQLKSNGIKTSKLAIYNYLYYFEDAFFCFFLSKFDFSIKKSVIASKKIFLNDVGIAGRYATHSNDTGRLMENAVFLELKRRFYESDKEIYYWKDYSGREVDFIIKKGNRVEQLIQVTYASGINDIEKRELLGLGVAGNSLKCNNMIIITWDYDGTVYTKKTEAGINCISLWKWLISYNE